MSDGLPAAGSSLLGAADVRALAAELGIRPTKQLGQNFVIDANTVRRIVRTSGVAAEDIVLEVGPGLGSLTLGLLPEAGQVVAIEIDPVLAAALPKTVALHAPSLVSRLEVLTADAMRVTEIPGPAPTALVANLPYNIAVPVLLHLWELLPSLRHTLVMVQKEVADRLASPPGSRTYGVPSLKAAWYGKVRKAGSIGRTVFWPAPRVDSGLVAVVHHPAPVTRVGRAEVFAVIDAAFAQRRKTLRAALADWAGSTVEAEVVLRRAGLDPSARGEQLSLEQFVSLADARLA